jgi:hypothetical protein
VAGTAFSSLISQARGHLLELPSISTPAAPTVTPQGTTGATAYSYKVVARNRDQRSIASSAGSTSTGNATLSSTNFNRVTWTAVTGATFYEIHRTASSGTPATTGIVAIVGAVLQLDDTGLTADSSTAPSAASGGVFWTDDELVSHLVNGCYDLWGSILDVYGDHYLTVDTTNVSLAANGTQLTGVPTDCYRIVLIEPSDTTSTGNSRGIIFTPRKYNSPDFANARTRSAVSSTAIDQIFYAVTDEGSPIGAPVILTAPKIDSAITLRLAYNQSLGAPSTFTTSSTNPIPGFSDQALIDWCVAYARAKERDDRSPDPNWLAGYATEKQHILTRLTPRQVQEPEYVEGLFEGLN